MIYMQLDSTPKIMGLTCCLKTRMIVLDETSTRLTSHRFPERPSGVSIGGWRSKDVGASPKN